MKIRDKILYAIIISMYILLPFNIKAITNNVDNFDTFNELLLNEENIKTIVLTDDIQIPDKNGVTIKSGQDVTIDLNGHELSISTDSESTSYLIKNQGKLTIKDSTDIRSIPGYASNTISNYGELIVESGSIINNTKLGESYIPAAYAIDSNSNNTKNIINGGRIYSLKSKGIRMYATSTTLGNSAEINGGIIEGYWGMNIQVSSNANVKADVTINGGTIKGENRGFYVYDSSNVEDSVNVKINNGHFIATETDGMAVWIHGTYLNAIINDGIYDADCALYYSSYYKNNEKTLTINNGTFNGYMMIYQDFVENDNSEYVSNLVINNGKFADDFYLYIKNYASTTNTKFINNGIFTLDGKDSWWQYYIKEGFNPTGKIKSLPEKFPYTFGYKVDLKANYEDGNDDIIYTTVDGKLTEIYSMEREGYDFVEWNTKKDGTGTKVTSNSVISNDSTLYAIWKVVPGNKTADVVSKDFEQVIVDLDSLLDFSLTKEDKKQIEDGNNITVELEITNIDETIEKKEKEKLEKFVKDNNYIIGNYIDVSLIKKIETKSSIDKSNIEETSELIKISINIPEELVNKEKEKISRKYSVARVHDGKVELLDTEYDSKKEMLTFETDKFSTYSIIYDDTEIKNEEEPIINPNDVDNPETGDSSYIYIIVSLISFVSLFFIFKKFKIEFNKVCK